MDIGVKLVEPIYPLAYAATLAGLDATTARRWLQGYSYKRNGEQRQSAPVLHVPFHPTGRKTELSFEELLTLRLVRAFREKGLGLPTMSAMGSATRSSRRRFGQMAAPCSSTSLSVGECRVRSGFWSRH